MKKKRIISIRDGQLADSKIIEYFGLDSLCRDGKYNFVGFINKKDKILVSCPKHFIYQNENDIRLIILCILKSFRNTDKGSTEKVDCNIPFREYLNVLDYFYKYGLFKESDFCYKQGYAGKINWNKTIRKSQPIVSNDNLIFLPFEVKHTVYEDTFVGECMQYVINDGYEQFGKYAAVGERISNRPLNYNFKNTETIIKQLKDEEGKHFRDSEIQLIRSLISYLSWEGSITEKSFFLTQSFERSWESMVHQYLNANLDGYDKKNNLMIFKKNCRKYSFKKVSEPIESYKKNKLNHGFHVEFDHLAQSDEDGNILLFDSKYYEKISEANYKQISYNYFLISGSNGTNFAPDKIINGLILPTEGNYFSKTHIDRRDIDGVYIQEHYINLREVMERYALR